MVKRVSWKKGMRLTEDLLRASDNCNFELAICAMSLASASRFGLFPQARSFEVSLNVANGIVDVESLNCLAITKGGHLIDIQYDTRYTNHFETRAQIPESRVGDELILTVNAVDSQWRDINDGYESPVYNFALISANTPIPDNAMPIARIVNEYGWRNDDLDFVPPCLFVTSHKKYQELLTEFVGLLSAINTKAEALLHSDARVAIHILWPIIQQLMITIDKERDLMTPMSLLADVQKCVSAFICACKIDEYLELSNADIFNSFVLSPYNYKDAYVKIKEGIGLCYSIKEKIDKIPEIEGPKPVIREPEPVRETPPAKKKKYIDI